MVQDEALLEHRGRAVAGANPFFPNHRQTVGGPLLEQSCFGGDVVGPGTEEAGPVLIALNRRIKAPMSCPSQDQQQRSYPLSSHCPQSAHDSEYPAKRVTWQRASSASAGIRLPRRRNSILCLSHWIFATHRWPQRLNSGHPSSLPQMEHERPEWTYMKNQHVQNPTRVGHWWRALIVAMGAILLLFCRCPLGAQEPKREVSAEGLAATPPMGWNSWS